MCVQAFRAELAVEGLDEAIVCGLSWPREVQRDVVGIGPEIGNGGAKLGHGSGEIVSLRAE